MSAERGYFLETVEPGVGVRPDLSAGVSEIHNTWFVNNGLTGALNFLSGQGAVPLPEFFDNSALISLQSMGVLFADGFNDGTSSGKFRFPYDYIDRQGNVKGFKIERPGNPMAVVALDLSVLRDVPLFGLQRQMLGDVRHAWNAAGDGKTEVSDSLITLFQAALIRNDMLTGLSASDGVPHPSEWEKPFDLIAAMKALFSALSGESNSGKMRQGAVSDFDLGLTVGSSGLNSAIDEMVSREGVRIIGQKMSKT
jgi:hypothetical protein